MLHDSSLTLYCYLLHAPLNEDLLEIRMGDFIQDSFPTVWMCWLKILAGTEIADINPIDDAIDPGSEADDENDLNGKDLNWKTSMT